MDPNLEYHLNMATLFELLAMRYKYVDPNRHIFFYQKHLEHAMHVEQLYCHHPSMQHGSMHGSMHGGMYEGMSGKMPDKMPDKMPGKMPDKLPGKLPKYGQ